MRCDRESCPEKHLVSKQMLTNWGADRFFFLCDLAEEQGERSPIAPVFFAGRVKHSMSMMLQIVCKFTIKDRDGRCDLVHMSRFRTLVGEVAKSAKLK